MRHHQFFSVALCVSVPLWFKKVFSACSCIHSACSAVSFCLVAAVGRARSSVVQINRSLVGYSLCLGHDERDVIVLREIVLPCTDTRHDMVPYLFGCAHARLLQRCQKLMLAEFLVLFV